MSEPERFARRHPELPLDEVEAGDELGDGMLDLQARVHLQEEELAVLVQELHRPGVDVAARLGDGDGGGAHGLADLVGEVGRRALLDELLVPPLARAVALAQPQRVAVGVGEDLHLDVAGPRKVLLQVDLGPAEIRLRLALGRLHGLGDFIGPVDDLHPPAAAAEGGLDGHGPAELLAERAHLDRRRPPARSDPAPPKRRPPRLPVGS